MELTRVRRLAATGAARALRLDAGLSLGELAAEVGTTKMTVSRWERGLRRPRGDLAARYLDVLERLAER